MWKRRCADVQMCRCADVQMCRCADVQMCRCADVQMCRCADVQMCRCADVTILLLGSSTTTNVFRVVWKFRKSLRKIEHTGAFLLFLYCIRQGYVPSGFSVRWSDRKYVISYEFVDVFGDD